MRDGSVPLAKQEKSLALLKGIHKHQQTEWMLMSLLHPGSIGALTLCKCRPALTQAPPLLGLDQRFEPRSSLIEKDYIRNFIYLMLYDQIIQQRVKGVGHMGGK